MYVSYYVMKSQLDLIFLLFMTLSALVSTQTWLSDEMTQTLEFSIDHKTIALSLLLKFPPQSVQVADLISQMDDHLPPLELLYYTVMCPYEDI